MNFKVLHILARADMGGGPRHVQYLLEAIKDNVDCFVCCPTDEPFFDVFKKMLGESKITVIPHRKVSLTAFSSLSKFVTENNISIIHCHGKGASVYGKLLKIFGRNKTKLIYTPHGIHIDEYSAFARFVYILYEYLSSFLFNYVIYVSESEFRKAKRSNLFTYNKSSVIPNAVPKVTTSNYDPINLKSGLFEHPERKIIITLSRFDYQKNMEEAFAIARLLPQYNFLWLGDGDDFLKIKNEADKLLVKNINMVGIKNSVGNFLSVSDLYLSTARWEGMPLALLEAISAGLPIVASNVIGNKDIVNEGTGALYDLGNIYDATEKIKYILETSALDKQAIEHYYETHFSMNIMSSKIINLYREFARSIST
jgi:glycosyltransferase involved in cell wall biosynthesis